ncbi:MAG: DUF1731 domain-containing protein, partial [Bdellovibrionales bacterium]|nr:DUF1731 domain-containing protein [Bdellovibrionales bacterium]
STSAIGYYGDTGDILLEESHHPGTDFLSDVCQKWESAVTPIEKHSRLVILRLGVVLDNKGGFLKQIEPIFSNYFGGQVGNGKQWLSWIHIQDLINMYFFVLDNKNINGVFNASSPLPITNKEFTKALAHQLGVPSICSAPSTALKLVLGEKSLLALHSQRIDVQKILALGFKFEFEDIKTALQDLYSWKKNPYQQLFYSEQWIPKSIDKIFLFFSEAKNLEKLTPPWLHFCILDQSTERMQKGTLITYKLKIHGIPIKWKTEILEWNPQFQFIDNQLSGPYKKWHHTHSFYSTPQNGTLMQDKIIFELPMGLIGMLFTSRFVTKDIQTIFDYRTQAIRQLGESLL